MGKLRSGGRLEFLLKTTISHRVPEVVGNSLLEFGQSALKLKNVSTSVKQKMAENFRQKPLVLCLFYLANNSAAAEWDLET